MVIYWTDMPINKTNCENKLGLVLNDFVCLQYLDTYRRVSMNNL